MDQTIVGDDIGHREDPAVPLLGQRVTAGAGQHPVRAHQRVVHPVHSPGDRSHPGQVQLRHRRAGQHSRLGAGTDQGTQRLGVQPHIRVQVDPGVRPADAVAQTQRVRLAGHVRLEHPHAVHSARRLRRTVGAGVGHHHDIQLARRAAVQQPLQVGGDDRFLVVCRHDDADHGLVHAAHSIAGRTEHAIHG